MNSYSYECFEYHAENGDKLLIFETSERTVDGEEPSLQSNFACKVTDRVGLSELMSPQPMMVLGDIYQEKDGKHIYIVGFLVTEDHYSCYLSFYDGRNWGGKHPIRPTSAQIVKHTDRVYKYQKWDSN